MELIERELDGIARQLVFISLRHTRISSSARAINRNSAAQKMTAAALYGRRSIYGRETDETTAQSRTS